MTAPLWPQFISSGTEGRRQGMIDLILVLFGSHAHKAKASHLISAAHLTHFRFGDSIQNRF